MIRESRREVVGKGQIGKRSGRGLEASDVTKRESKVERRDRQVGSKV